MESNKTAAASLLQSPIKFREYLGNGKWHYWGLIDDTFVSPMRFYNGKRLLSQQYTGVSDRNGNDIYEGDVLYVQWPEEIEGWDKVEVVWCDAGFRFLYDGVEYDAHQMRYDQQLSDIWMDNSTLVSDIIGNNLENPELIDLH